MLKQVFTTKLKILWTSACKTKPIFRFSCSFIIIWDFCCCIKVNSCWKLSICSCCCLVCSTKTFIISWCCFLDWSSRLSSTSTRWFCRCNSSSFHFWTRSFFFRANMQLCHLHFYDFFALVSLSPPLCSVAFSVFRVQAF